MRARRLAVSLLSTTMLSAALPAAVLAQTTPAAPAAADDPTEIVVTAQKRSEKLSSVPISIQALTSKKLDQLNVSNFNDYAAQLTSVSFQTSQPGSTNVYLRGVASGGDGNHSGSLPSVGVYLDEQPVTTIGGALDVHIYDIERIESLAGPQGTLYGASSEAGTIRIITNKPSSAGFYGRLDTEINKIDGGDNGYKLEGMLNIPFNDKVALRVVGWKEHVGGYIDNVAGTRSFLPDPGGISVDNAALVEKNFNDVTLEGGRAALKVDLTENWTATGTVMGQSMKSGGVFGMDASVGDLQVQHFYPDWRKDRFMQAALTLQGKIGNFDITYAGAHMTRHISSSSDYTDYAESYDAAYASYGGLAGYFYFNDANGDTIDPRQYIIGNDDFEKNSHELRIATPSDKKLRFVGGLFYQKQTHDILQDYIVPGLAPELSVNGRPGTLWLTLQERVDEDKAIFGEVSYDITPKLTVTAGLRGFKYDNSLIGFFGFGRNPDGPPWNGAGSSRTGVAGCYTTSGQTVRDDYNNNVTSTVLPGVVAGTYCTNLGVLENGHVSPKHAKGDGTTYRLNLTWKADTNRMYYATVSKGFRPGGINRRSTIAPYAPDYLTNYEIGWKVYVPDMRLRWNGAIYHQKWDSFQFSYLGLNSFTEIHNGPNAKIDGLESDITWTPITGLSVALSGSYTDAKTEQNLCSVDDPTYQCASSDIVAPKGTRLPITPKVKLSGNARYSWSVGTLSPYVQGVITYQGKASSDLRLDAAAVVGDLPSYTTANLASGVEWKNWTFEAYVSNLTDERAQISRYVQCSICTRAYAVVAQPRTFGIRIGSAF